MPSQINTIRRWFTKITTPRVAICTRTQCGAWLFRQQWPLPGGAVVVENPNVWAEDDAENTLLRYVYVSGQEHPDPVIIAHLLKKQANQVLEKISKQLCPTPRFGWRDLGVISVTALLMTAGVNAIVSDHQTPNKASVSPPQTSQVSRIADPIPKAKKDTADQYIPPRNPPLRLPLCSAKTTPLAN